jgi:penicillin-binding protein 1A
MVERLPDADELIRRAPGDWGPRAEASVQASAGGGAGDSVGASAGAEPDTGSAPKRRRWLTWARIRLALQLTLLLFILLFAWLAITAPLSKSLQPVAPPRITLLASDGTPFAQNGAEVEAPVVAAKLPKHVRGAFIAIEDRRFRDHWGVDPRGLARAAWSNLTSRRTQGGSTITQQLAKMSFLTPERSMTRKAREMLIAFWLEAWLTKDEILERYLSTAYFGDNVYGLRAASRHYFSRQPETLTIGQAAMLAGLVQAPSRLAPTHNLKGARARAALVLTAMTDTGVIGETEARAAQPIMLKPRASGKLPSGTYFADWMLPQVRAASEGRYTDLKITTTLDTRLQRIARRVVSNAPLGKAQIALVAMRPTGEVVAMVGGRSYKGSPFNRATQARRQPGSTFKLFVYTAAMRGGMTPDSMVDDSPIADGAYKPKNSGARYRGAITLNQAFARSSNVAAVRLYRQVGGDAVVTAARDLGIRSPLAKDPALALGASGVTLIELTSAYAAIAANRYPMTPRAVTQSPEQEGLFDRLLTRESSFDRRTHQALLTLLKNVVDDGTGRAAKLAIPAYGKTGTSQDSRDALFIGFAGDMVVGIWIGNDDNSPLKGINGGGLPARIWRDFLAAAIPGARPVVQPKPAPIPDDLPVDLNLSLGNDIAVELGSNASVTVDTELGRIRLDGEGLSIDNEARQSDAKR